MSQTLKAKILQVPQKPKQNKKQKTKTKKNKQKKLQRVLISTTKNHAQRAIRIKEGVWEDFPGMGHLGWVLRDKQESLDDQPKERARKKGTCCTLRKGDSCDSR